MMSTTRHHQTSGPSRQTPGGDGGEICSGERDGVLFGTPLANTRHELFARGIAAGRTAHQAYIDAGYAPSRSNASRLRTNEHVKRRVAELMTGAIGVVRAPARVRFEDEFERVTGWRPDDLRAHLVESCGLRGLRVADNPDVSAIATMIWRGFDLNTEIIPAIRAAVATPLRNTPTWYPFVVWIEREARRPKLMTRICL